MSVCSFFTLIHNLKLNCSFYVYGSVHRWPILIIVQRDATQSSLFIILQVHSTCFGCQPHPPSGVQKTGTTASSTGYIFCTAWPRWREVAAQNIWPVPKAVVTVLCTPDDGCGWHPKHVEWTCRIIYRLLCVAYRWAIISIYCPCLLELGSKSLGSRIKYRHYSRHTECTVPTKFPDLCLVQSSCLLERGEKKAKSESLFFSEQH